jgi:hypothetical protein
MMMESVEEGCHSDGTPYYRDCEEDIQMYLTLPMLGVDNGNAVSENSLDNSSTDLCSRYAEVCESNVRTINITFDDEMVSNFYFAI